MTTINGPLEIVVRLDTGNMLSPRDPRVRLVHVGAVYGPGPCPPGWIELSRGRAGKTPPG